MKHLIMRFSSLALAIGLMISTGQCAVGPVYGSLYTSTTFAGEVNPANDVVAQKTATGCHRNLIFLFTWGDAGAGDIANANGIKRIATIDHSTQNILYLYREYCTIVSGQ